MLHMTACSWKILSRPEQPATTLFCITLFCHKEPWGLQFSGCLKHLHHCMLELWKTDTLWTITEMLSLKVSSMGGWGIKIEKKNLRKKQENHCLLAWVRIVFRAPSRPLTSGRKVQWITLVICRACTQEPCLLHGARAKLTSGLKTQSTRSQLKL